MRSHDLRQKADLGRVAFTLIEVLVVVAIIALLIAILLPSLRSARDRARAVACAANLRTAANGLVYYTEANKGYYPEASHWAQYAYLYVQRRSGNRPYEGYERFSDGASIHIGYYSCPGDALRHEETGSLNINGVWKKFNYRLSYGLNGYLVNHLTDPNAAKQGISYRCSGDLENRRKVSQVARPSEIVSLADAGNDNINSPTEMYWDFDDDWDPGGTSLAVLEVHHRDGNNFLHADSHVDYEPILSENVWHRGVPKFPWRWVPLAYLSPPQQSY